MDNLSILLLAIILALAALGLFFLSRQQRRKTGLPGGRIVYVDTQAWRRVEKSLYDPELGLTGKPDYLVEQNGQLIPVEVKSARGVVTPYDAHIYQLAAYCLLVERLYSQRPAYGILHYPDRSFAIDYSEALEAELCLLITDMQESASKKPPDRSHQSPQRCVHCGFRSICDQVLRI